MKGNSRLTRFTIVAAALVLGALGLLVRFGFLMLGARRPQANAGTELVSGRGPILDRNGKILAMETRIGNITLWVPSMKEFVTSAELSRELAPILELPREEIQERIDNAQSGFLYLKKEVDEITIGLIQDAITAGRLPGVGIEPTLNRVYPEGSLAAQILGFTKVDNSAPGEITEGVTSTRREGLAGIEYAFNDELSPSVVSTLPGTRKRQNGSQVYLTLDINVQHILENIAARVLEENKAEAVMFMAVDPRTGEILGSASLPGFDPNSFGVSSETERMDRPAIWSYEPGSVFKIFSLAALMDEGAIKDDTVFICNGHYERISASGERNVINCLESHGRVSARDIIIKSCNAGAAYAADQMDAALFSSILREFGFGARTQAGNPGETMGFFRAAERWSDRSKPTIAMGQEIAVSALQMIQAATAIANDGVLVPPRIVSRIVSADEKTVQDFPVNPPRQVLKPETARAMRSYMMDVTSSIGTGWRANVEDLSLAVKTGTAEVIDPATGAYSHTDFIASCMAFLPAESPSLILYLAIVKPQGVEFLGGRIAAPPIREAAEELINYLGIPRGRNPQVSHPGVISIPPVSYPEINDAMPDFTGLSKRQLLPLILREDLHFRISGDGWVKRQEPPPGTLLGPDTMIILELE